MPGVVLNHMYAGLKSQLIKISRRVVFARFLADKVLIMESCLEWESGLSARSLITDAVIKTVAVSQLTRPVTLKGHRLFGP